MVSPKLIGQRFVKLIARERVRVNNRVYWRCECDCGGWLTVRTDHLMGGHADSCGCVRG